MLACPRAFAFVFPFFEIFHVSDWSEQTANAMLLYVYLALFYVLVYCSCSIEYYIFEFANLQNFFELIANG